VIDKGIFMTHKFSVGQKVTLLHRMYLSAPAGEYEVRKLMPDEDRNSDDPIYRIKSSGEPHERIAQESDLARSAL
jgi:hypothetical protein